MIGKVYVPASFSKRVINPSNNTNQKREITNTITGSVINVRSFDCDFRIICKELLLYRDEKNGPLLKSIPANESLDKQNTRLNLLGMGVTAVSNLGKDGIAKEKADDICSKNPRTELIINQSMELHLDPAITDRGIESIKQIIDTETPLDSTYYAIGLLLGCDIKNTRIDIFLIGQFQKTWETLIGMNTIKK